jgi:hypothetical protein
VRLRLRIGFTADGTANQEQVDWTLPADFASA